MDILWEDWRTDNTEYPVWEQNIGKGDKKQHVFHPPEKLKSDVKDEDYMLVGYNFEKEVNKIGGSNRRAAPWI